MALPFRFLTPSPEAKACFGSAPWCTKYFSDSDLRPITINFDITPSKNSLFYRTLSTDSTIRALQGFYKAPTAGQQTGELVALLSLGPGLNGYEDILHGGFIGLIFDELLGVPAILARPTGKSSMTASLKVDYKKSMTTPGIYVCRGWVEKAEGRKIFTKGTLKDGEGNLFATGEILFVLVDQVSTREKL